ncbi:hypothetical protein EVA_06375 [gut metagenome]|uniref:Uncharacterized protein n=1 Tax=gut metagenome TaxID=749906 RepID=J9GF38_9ZZZZ
MLVWIVLMFVCRLKKIWKLLLYWKKLKLTPIKWAFLNVPMFLLSQSCQCSGFSRCSILQIWLYRPL